MNNQHLIFARLKGFDLVEFTHLHLSTIYQKGASGDGDGDLLDPLLFDNIRSDSGSGDGCLAPDCDFEYQMGNGYGSGDNMISKQGGGYCFSGNPLSIDLESV
jgi:hypothetical protein